jgi:hypothetical protein
MRCAGREQACAVQPAPAALPMTDRNHPREPFRWEEERERQDRGLESERRFARHAGDARWGTGGLRVDHRMPRSRLGSPPPSTRPGVTAAGPYAGRGPRGYVRTDERIREDVSQRLTEHGWIDASDIEVTVATGTVTLAGAVTTRSQKHLAEEVAVLVAGVIEVSNRLIVQRATVP